MYQVLTGPDAGQFVSADYNAAPKKLMFGSQREFKRWQYLDTLNAAGAITGLRRQVGFALHAAGGILVTRYYADFVYVECGQRVVEDCKGRKTRMYILKKKWMLAEHGITIRES